MNSQSRLRRDRQCGQVMPYVLAMMLVLVISWGMLLNIARLLTTRMMLQNAADNAALSCAVLRARTLNLLGATNYLMAATLSLGAFPCLTPVALYNTAYIGGSALDKPFPFSDVRCSGSPSEFSTDYAGVNRIRFMVTKLQQTQRLLVASYAVNTARVAQVIGSQQERNASGEDCGADYTLCLPGSLAGSVLAAAGNGGGNPVAARSVSPERLLGVTRNALPITYYQTVNIGVNVPEHRHIVWFRKWLTEDGAWYTAADTFYDQKLVALAVKRATSSSNRGYPFLRGLSGGISWPTIMAVAAAGVYNTRGSMLPERQEAYTGIPEYLIGPLAAAQAYQLQKMRGLIADAARIPYIGACAAGAVAGVAAGVTAVAAASLAAAVAGRETPIKKYEQAEYRGWDAHLVPVGVAGVSH